MMFGVGVNSDAGVGGSLVLSERNFDLFRVPTSFSDLFSGSAFRGAGQELRIEAVPGDLVNRYSISLLEPYLFGTDVSLQSSGYYYRRLFENYAEQRGGRPLHARLSLQSLLGRIDRHAAGRRGHQPAEHPRAGRSGRRARQPLPLWAATGVVARYARFADESDPRPLHRNELRTDIRRL